MSKPRIPDEWDPLIPGSYVLPARAFDDIIDDIESAMAKWGRLGGFTFNPKTGHVFDVKVASEALALYREVIEGSDGMDLYKPIHIIAVTCNKIPRANIDLKKGYENITKLSDQPMIGYWIHGGEGYLDAVFPAHFINSRGAIEAGKRHEQDYILRIHPDGEHEFVKTH